MNGLAEPIGDSRDADFWVAHREFCRLEAAWEADPDDSEANWDAHAARVSGAFNRMMTIEVSTAAAVLAKYVTTDGDRTAIEGPAEDSVTMIRRDLERLASREA